jgi:3-oxoacyl-[acyl-carrier protein] reductase
MSTNTSTQKTLNGKVAFIQGGSRGIGAAIAVRLAREGAAVAISYASSAKQAQEVVQVIEAAGGKALALKADSADPKALTQAIDTAATAFGRIDILVNNAGVLALGSIEEFKLEDFDRTLAVNVRSVFVATQAAVKYMGEGLSLIHI